MYALIVVAVLHSPAGHPAPAGKGAEECEAAGAAEGLLSCRCDPGCSGGSPRTHRITTAAQQLLQCPRRLALLCSVSCRRRVVGRCVLYHHLFFAGGVCTSCLIFSFLSLPCFSACLQGIWDKVRPLPLPLRWKSYYFVQAMPS